MRTGALRAKVLGDSDGAVALAFGAVELALHDLRGKAEGCPVHALLGGKVRDRIRLYGSAGMYQSPTSYAAEAAAVAGLGFSAYKMRPAMGPCVCFSEDVCAWLEYPCYAHRGQPIMYPYPLADEILAAPLHIEDGELIVPDKARLGIAVNESVLERYPYVPGPWSVFRLTSPPEEWVISGDHATKWEEK